MVLNYIFIGFFLIALAIGLMHLVFTGDFSLFNAMMQSTFEQAKNGFEISLYLTGVLSLWLGFIRIAEQSGLMQRIARRTSPVLSCLFPSVPKDHPALGNAFMNFAANLLGLDNAATPLGLKTMESLQELNDRKESASDAMIMFLAINASGLTIIPTSIIAYRMQAGADNPADVFLPILVATAVSTLVAVIAIGIRQRINFLRRPLFLTLLSVILLIGTIVWSASALPAELFRTLSTGVSSLILFAIICGFLISGMRARINVYDAFIKGAKEGFHTAVGIIPYLIAVLVGIGVFRASGAMDYLIRGIRWVVESLGGDIRFVEALPTMLMKPLSGSGARGLMVDAMQTYGADSFVGRLCCTVQGATDTTLYVVALYYGAVRVRNSRYTVGYSLLADLAGCITAVSVTYLFFS